MLGTAMTVDEVKHAWGVMDGDHSGLVGFEEFKAWWKNELHQVCSRRVPEEKAVIVVF